jgi:hypothetical protein
MRSPSSFLLALAGALAGLLASEGAVRLARPDLSLESFRAEDFPNTDVFRPSAVLPYEPVPGIPGYTNSLGMRDKEYALRKPPGVRRIVFLGDSVTMYSRFTDLMEEALDARFPGRYEIWNCAVGGFSLREYAVLMREKVARCDPDFVVLSFCLNDVTDATRVLYFGADGRLNAYKPLSGIPTRLDNWLYKRSAIYRLQVRLRESRPKDPGQREIDVWARRALSTVLSEAARLKAPVKALVFPYLKPLSEWTDEERFNRDHLNGLLREFGVPALDLAEVFPSSEISTYRNHPADLLHLNPLGDERAARAARRFLADQNVLPSP